MSLVFLGAIIRRYPQEFLKAMMEAGRLIEDRGETLKNC